MKISYEKQRILLTGASAGIGKEMARILAAKGAKSLVLVARREEALEDLKRELIQAHPNVAVYIYPCDLSQRTAIDHLLHFVSREVGAVDILINNAGFGDYTLFENASWEKTERMLRLNIEGLTYLTYKLIPPMIALGRGGVLNISSSLGLLFMPGMSVYAATKHYVTAFTEGLRLELKGTGVLVAQTCPGPVESEFAAVAGNRTESNKAPAWLKLSAQQCAQEALQGFARGKALVYPGEGVKVLMGVMNLMPRAVKRWVFASTRKKLLQAQEAPQPQDQIMVGAQ